MSVRTTSMPQTSATSCISGERFLSVMRSVSGIGLSYELGMMNNDKQEVHSPVDQC